MDSHRENLQTLDLEVRKDDSNLGTIGCGNVAEDSTLCPPIELSQMEIQVRVLRKPRENKWRRYAEEIARYKLMGSC